jgi:hypothetical protein
MSIESTLDRIGAIRQAIADPSSLMGSGGAITGGTEAPSSAGTSTSSTPTSFAQALSQASASEAGAAGGSVPASGTGSTAIIAPTYAPPLSNGAGYSSTLQGLEGIAGVSRPGTSTGPGSRIVSIAESQIGQSEQPPGSNESSAIAQYRSATAGAIPGAPWCAYFASWAASQAGEPIGAQGQGLGSVGEIWSWAQSTGRAVPNGPGVVPKPGDLIVFGDEHVGIVRGVLPNGQISTIEGNYENKVAANVRSPSEASGYVSMG